LLVPSSSTERRSPKLSCLGRRTRRSFFRNSDPPHSGQLTLPVSRTEMRASPAISSRAVI
jgi:hypothetical protein